METGLTLTGDMMLVLVVLAITIALFVFEVVRVDVVALSVMVLLGLIVCLMCLTELPTIKSG